MRRIEIDLPDETADQLNVIVGEFSYSVADVLALGVSQLSGNERLKEWMPPEQWEGLVKGDTCPICPGIHDDVVPPDFGYVVARLKMSRLMLIANQYVRGYCILTCNKHVTEPFELPPEERTMYFDDLMRSAQAIAQVFQPIKINYEILGNSTPHLHCHIKPRHRDDQVPNAPLAAVGKVLLEPTEYEARLIALRDALDGLS